MFESAFYWPGRRRCSNNCEISKKGPPLRAALQFQSKLVTAVGDLVAADVDVAYLAAIIDPAGEAKVGRLAGIVTALAVVAIVIALVAIGIGAARTGDTRYLERAIVAAFDIGDAKDA